MAWPRWGGAVVAAAVLLGGDPVRARQAEETPAGSNGPPASVEAAETTSPGSDTPIADSVDAAVDRFVRERMGPCGGSSGVPCFPVTLEVEGRRYSVREGLERLELDSRPAPGPPSAAEIIQQGANPRSASASVGFDPKAIVCKTRQLMRKIQGKSRRYYLYRVWDEHGERAVLRDRPLDPESPESATFEYVSLGEFGDECQAVKAYLRVNHGIRARKEAAGPQPPPHPGLEMRSEDVPR